MHQRSGSCDASSITGKIVSCPWSPAPGRDTNTASAQRGKPHVLLIRLAWVFASPARRHAIGHLELTQRVTQVNAQLHADLSLLPDPISRWSTAASLAAI